MSSYCMMNGPLPSSVSDWPLDYSHKPSAQLLGT